MSIFLILCVIAVCRVSSTEILMDHFVPRNPILRADAGLLSVNIPPVYFREKYWLHTLVIDMPCVDSAIKPDILVLSREMNYSTTSIMKMVSKINLDILNDESRLRVNGPIKSLHQTYSMFLSFLRDIQQSHREVTSDYMNLWGLLPNDRCGSSNVEDMGDHLENMIDSKQSRLKRSATTAFDPTKHNVVNVEGTGHTFIFNHGSSTQDQTPVRTSDITLVQPDTESVQGFKAHRVSITKNAEGQVFSKIQTEPQSRGLTDLPSCQISARLRLKYITCVIEHSIEEQLC